MNAILDRIDAELREQIDYNNLTSIVDKNSKIESLKEEEDSSFSAAGGGQSFLKDIRMRMQKLAFVKKKDAPEIRRHPTRNGNNEFNILNGNVLDENGNDGRRKDNLNKEGATEERQPPMAYGKVE